MLTIEEILFLLDLLEEKESMLIDVLDPEKTENLIHSCEKKLRDELVSSNDRV